MFLCSPYYSFILLPTPLMLGWVFIAMFHVGDSSLILSSGLGFGLLYLPSVVGVGFYFEKKRALATGVAVCGTGVGTFCMTLIMKELIEYVDWKGAHFVFGKIILPPTFGY